MRRPLLNALILAAGCALAVDPAAAQSWGNNSGYGHARGGSNPAPSAFDWRSQLDRPGDYRCDAFWDAGRTDCDARWRDQRHRVSAQARRDYAALAGGSNYGDGHAYNGHEDGYPLRRRGYGRVYGHGYGQAETAYHGAFGRPDLVYPVGRDGRAGRDYSPGRNSERIDWCLANYRSYDPSSGYYRAYSGQLIFCG